MKKGMEEYDDDWERKESEKRERRVKEEEEEYQKIHSLLGASF